jgi:hypothetical protein
MSWIIENVDEPELAWSNEWGWCEDTFDTFSDEEKETLNLPLGGRWKSVPWTVAA